MQSGEAQATGVSRQHSSTSVIKGKGSKGKSLAQLLFGLIPSAGPQAKPFGKVLRQLQGKLPVLGKSQSRLQAKKGSGTAQSGGTVRSSLRSATTPTVGKRISEAAKQTLSLAKGVTPSSLRQVAPATSASKTPKAPALATAPTAVSAGRAKPAPALSAAQTDVSQTRAKPAPALSAAQTDVSQTSAKPAPALSTTPTVVSQASAKPGLSSRRAEAGKPTGSMTTASISPENHAQAKDVDPNAPVSDSATRTPAPIDGVAQTVPGTQLAAQVVSADPNSQPAPDRTGNAHRTSTAQPQSQGMTPSSVKTVPANQGHSPATAQGDASVDAPHPLTQAQPDRHGVQATPPRVAPVPVQATLAAVSDTPKAAISDRGAPAHATTVVQRWVQASPAFDDKSITGTGPRPSFIPNSSGAPAVVRLADPSGLTTDPIPATIAGATEGNTGDSKRLDVRSSKAKQLPLTFVMKSDGGKTTDVQTAPAGRPAARADSRPAAQAAPQAQDVGVKGLGANTEPVVNSLTTNDRPSFQLAGSGNGELKIINPADLGTQGTTETSSRPIQVPVTQAPTLTHAASSAAPHLANLARMTVVHYNRYVSGSQNQNVFQVDGGALGNVKITFSEASAGTTLSIVVDSPELQQQLQRALPQLQQAWSNLNLNLGQVNVQVSDSRQDKAFKGEEGQPSNPGRQSTEDVDVPVEIAMERIMDYGYNSVEYVA